MVYIIKSQPEPVCLTAERAKANGDYNCPGVLAANKEDFYNKCYVCEFKEPTTINTEHFVPHRNDHVLKFQWNNLFYACGHCNNTKLAKAEFDNILNCIIEADEVDKKIRYHINPYPKEKAEFSPVEDSLRVQNTVILLDEAFNGATELKKIESANLRSHLLKEIRNFQAILFDFFDDTFSPDERAEKRNSIIRHLGPASNFTAFKRWIVRDNALLFDEFGAYC